MLRVVESDRIERLLGVLAARVGERRDPFERFVIATPTRVVERRAETAIALALGIAGGLEHVRLASLLERRLAEVSGRRVIGGALLEGLLRDVLLDDEALRAPLLGVVRAYVLGAEGSARALRERRACELAARLSFLYGSYAQDRFELVAGWLRGEPGEGPLAAWQGALLRCALARAGEGVASIVEAPEVLAREGLAGRAPLAVVGYSYLTRLEHACVAALARRGEVLVLAPSPCAEFWEDATPRAAREGAAELESTLLGAWGTAAREHLTALAEASAYTGDRLFDAPSDEAEPTALARLQSSIRERRAVRAASGASTDDTLVQIAAPALRREVEAVAAEIWAIVHEGARRAQAEGGEPIRFPDIAVWLPARDRDLYLPHVETVFAEAHDIPWSGVDLALASRSRAVEAAVRLVGLVEGGPTRAALLDVVTHPLVLARLGDAPEPDALASTLDRLGVFFGASEGELPAAYATGPRAVDVGQAIERLALGAAMLGEASGQTGSFERGAQRWLPEEHEGAAELVLLLRSLVADVHEARRAERTVAEWGRFFAALVEAYVVVEGFEEAELARATAALARLDATPRAEGERGPAIGCDAACTLAMRALESLPAVRGETERGVLVGTLAPHRASSHRVVFVLGLGEGRFPARASDAGLDLRAGDRRKGEVTPEDRDRLALLEAVVSARDRLVLSWVARDEQTGDAIAPAHALAELVRAVGTIETRTPGLRRDREALELTRAGEDPARPPRARAAALVRAAALPLAAEEARARVLGDEERSTWAQSATPLRDLATGLAETDARRALLALPVVPPATSVLRGPIRVSLAELRASLDCAVQAAGKRLVGVVDDGEGGDLDAEPFELGATEHERLVRSVVLAHLSGATSEATTLDLARIDREVERRVAHGEFPLGAFGERARRRARETAEEVLEELSRVRPGRRAVRTTRFGAGREHGDDASEARDPIRVGEAAVRGEPRPIEIVGTTQPLLGAAGVPGAAGAPGDELVRLDLGPRRSGERRTVAELRHALHAFVDHAALAAASSAPGKARRALVLTPRGSLEIQLAPVRPEVARRWLAKLARDVALEPQTSFLPIEAVLRVAHLFRTGSADVEAALAASIEHVRTKWDGGRSQYGPIREAVRLPAPAAPARVVGERFSIFFTHLVRPEIRPPERRKS